MSTSLRAPSLESRAPSPESRYTRPMATRLNVSSGTKWEPVVGYSRAVRVGQIVHVSGTTATDASGELVGKGDARMQAVQALKNIRAGARKGWRPDRARRPHADLRHQHPRLGGDCRSTRRGLRRNSPRYVAGRGLTADRSRHARRDRSRGHHPLTGLAVSGRAATLFDSLASTMACAPSAIIRR